MKERLFRYSRRQIPMVSKVGLLLYAMMELSGTTKTENGIPFRNQYRNIKLSLNHEPIHTIRESIKRVISMFDIDRGDGSKVVTAKNFSEVNRLNALSSTLDTEGKGKAAVDAYNELKDKWLKEFYSARLGK